MAEPGAGDVEKILEIGAEGGSLTLVGQRRVDGTWQFRLTTDESMLWDLIDEEPPAAQIAPWEPWEAALTRLNHYPWPRLHPLALHPEFADSIFELIATHEYGGRKQCARWRRMLSRKR